MGSAGVQFLRRCPRWQVCCVTGVTSSWAELSFELAELHWQWAYVGATGYRVFLQRLFCWRTTTLKTKKGNVRVSFHTELFLVVLSVSIYILVLWLTKGGKLLLCGLNQLCVGDFESQRGPCKNCDLFFPSLVIVLNLSSVWRLFVTEFGLVLAANSFGTRCDLGRGIISKAIAIASLSFCFMFEAW